MICPEYRPLWEGVEAADSLVLNPHKWLGAGFDLSAYFVRDPEHLVRVMSTDPSYLRTAQDGQVRNLRDWGIPLGRRFRALKLWFLIREYGVEGLQARIRRDMDNARWLAAQIGAEPGWELLAPVPLQTVCLRHVPAGARRRRGGAGGPRPRDRRAHQPGRTLLPHVGGAQGPPDRPRLDRGPGHRARRRGGACGTSCARRAPTRPRGSSRAAPMTGSAALLPGKTRRDHGESAAIDVLRPPKRQAQGGSDDREEAQQRRVRRERTDRRRRRDRRDKGGRGGRGEDRGRHNPRSPKRRRPSRTGPP